MSRHAQWGVVAVLLVVGVLLLLGRRSSQDGDHGNRSAPSAVTPSESWSRPVVAKSSGVPFDAQARRGSLDASRREELRRRLVDLFLRTNENTPDAMTPTGRAAPVGRHAAGQLPNDAESLGRFIQDRIHSDFMPMAEGCYKELLERQPRAQGDVFVRYEILADESVGGVVNAAELEEKSTLRDPELDTCLRESFLSLDFDQLRERSRVTADFPVHFADGKVDAPHEMHMKDRRKERAGEQPP